jgi:hypothetical protein
MYVALTREHALFFTYLVNSNAQATFDGIVPCAIPPYS